MISQDCVLAEQGQRKAGIAQMHHGLTTLDATGAGIGRPWLHALLAEWYGKIGQEEEGLQVVTAALAALRERAWESELYRLKGELTLQLGSREQGPRGIRSKESGVRSEQRKLKNTDSRPLTPDTQGEAEACFRKAIEIAQQQQAKSLELRATMSLARLWQSQGKKREAHNLLSGIYNWFTEGFDTKDFQEAKVLLEALSDSNRR